MDDDYSGHRVINKTIRTACIPASYPSSPQKPIMDWDWRFGLKEQAEGSNFAFARAGSACVNLPGGIVAQVGSNVPRYEPNGLTLEGSATNKVTCAKSNPADLTSISKTGDAAATLAVVDDSAALGAVGLSAFGPKVYKLDNSAGLSDAYAVSQGTVANTNAHSVSCYVRGSGQTATWINQSGYPLFALTSSYVRRLQPNITPAAVDRLLTIRATPGSIVYFTLPQLEEGPVCTSPIPGGTGAITRASEGADTSGNGLSIPLSPSMIASLSAGGEGTVLTAMMLPWSAPDSAISAFPLLSCGAAGAGLAYLNSSNFACYDGVNACIVPRPTTAGQYVFALQFSARTSKMRVGIYNPATGALTWGSYATYRGFFSIHSSNLLRFFYGGGAFPIYARALRCLPGITSNLETIYHAKEIDSL